MKIGTDAVLLGSFAARFPAQRLLDIGTGCGIIALMVIQKTRGQADAIEIDHNAYLQAGENFSKSPWPDKLTAHHCSLQDFSASQPGTYDLICCNPPFFQNSLHSPDKARTTARHNGQLSAPELFLHAAPLLQLDGKMVIIYPADCEAVFDDASAKASLCIHEKLYIHPNPQLPAKRVITVYARGRKEKVVSGEMSIETGLRHDFTDAYRNMTRDYHPFL